MIVTLSVPRATLDVAVRVGLRFAGIVAFATSTVGFQLPATQICHVDEGGQETSVAVPDAEAERVLSVTASYPGPCETAGPQAVLGEVTVRAFVQLQDDGTPFALGIRFPDSAFESLPSEPADGYRCLDLNEDRDIDVGAECVGGHERVLFLPRVWDDSVGPPFRWALFNWNPAGHGPPGVWDVAHFDFHFFIQSLADRSRIRIGRCAMLVDCDDLEVGTRPVPAPYLPSGYEDRGVVEFGMGNHLIDPATFGGPSDPPTHTLIYGAWGGRISFLEPMVTMRFLQAISDGSQPSRCYPVPRAQDVEEPGYYPTVYCIRRRPNRGEFVISLEGFELRSLPDRVR